MRQFPSRNRLTGPRAFTLVELLVVIGIIALLIAILMPTLATARRSANTVKCLSNLRQVGTAFQLYAADFKGAIPVVRQDLPDTGTSPMPAATANEYWTDRIGAYVAKAKFNNRSDLAEAMRTVVWGCTEWDGRNSTSGLSQYDTGYGMNSQLAFTADYPSPPTAAHPPTARAMRWRGVWEGKYWRMAQVTQSTERVLVADAMLWHLNARPSDGSGAASLPGQYQDANQVHAGKVAMPGLMDYDLFRHTKKPSRTIVKNGAGFFETTPSSKVAVNAVYFDGHAETIGTLDQAYRAIFMKNP